MAETSTASPPGNLSPPATSTSPTPTPSRDALVNAAAIRARATSHANKRRAQEHEMRQHFRRLVDPGIMRPNNKDLAIESLKTLLKLSDNLLDDPDNPKFQRFKSSNHVIKSRLIETRGALEYAVAMGFHAKVENFEKVYVFNHEQIDELRIGNEVIKETLDRELVRVERSKHAMEREKAAKEAAALQVKLAFEDDRKSQAIREELEAQQRKAHAERVAAGESEPTSPQQVSSAEFPLDGFRLGNTDQPGGPVSRDPQEDTPPAYDE